MNVQDQAQKLVATLLDEAKPKLIPAVRSLPELAQLARKDPRYRALAIAGAQNIGGPASEDLEEQLRYLYMHAAEASEEGVVDEVNFCRDLI